MGETAAKVLSTTAIELLESPEILISAKQEFKKRKKANYESPLIPEGITPPINLRWPEWIDRPGSKWWIPQ